MKTILDYALRRESSLPVRIFQSDKSRFDELQKRLTVASGGLPFSQGQVINFLLDQVERLEKFIDNPFKAP